MDKTISRLSPCRGDVYLVPFDPAYGSEIQKTRPALIIQNNIGNRFSSTVIVVAITSRKNDATVYPVEVLVPKQEGGLDEDSVILLDQIRTIDKKRLLKKFGSLKPETMRRVDQALAISIGLVKL